MRYNFHILTLTCQKAIVFRIFSFAVNYTNDMNVVEKTINEAKKNNIILIRISFNVHKLFRKKKYHCEYNE